MQAHRILPCTLHDRIDGVEALCGRMLSRLWEILPGGASEGGGEDEGHVSRVEGPHMTRFKCAMISRVGRFLNHLDDFGVQDEFSLLVGL